MTKFFNIGLLIFCFHGVISFGQKSEYDQFIELINTNAEEALTLGEQLLLDYENSGNIDTAYTNVAANLAYLQFGAGSLPEALETGEKCQSAMIAMGDTMTQDFSEIVYYNAIYSSYNEDYQGACEHLEHVLRIKDYLNVSSDEETFSIRWQMANMYASIDHDLAESNYKWVESYGKKTWDPLDSMNLVISNTLATFYFTNGRFEDAKPYYVNACDLVKEAYGSGSETYLLSLNSLGEFYIYAGMDEQAYDSFKETAKLSKKIYGEVSADHATSLNNLAVATDNLRDYPEAIKLYEKVLEIKASVYTTESDYYALSVMNLGSVYEKKGDYQEAKLWLEKALEIYEKLNDKSPTNHSTTLSHYSSVLASMGDYEEAKKADLLALDLQERQYGKKQAGYCNALQRYGMNLITYGEYSLAQETFENCCCCKLKWLENRTQAMLQVYFTYRKLIAS